MDKLFQGTVYRTQAFMQLIPLFPELESLIESFKFFWYQGYHSDLGKDVPYHRPPNAVLNSIRHIHVRPYIGSDDSIKWNRFFEHKSPENRPSSDRCLVYCVDSNRNCVLIAYYAQDAHKNANDLSNQAEWDRAANWFFQNRFPLDQDEQASLFDDKWKIADDAEFAAL